MNTQASDIERFRSLVHERLGLVFDDSRIDVLNQTLCRRIEANGGQARSYFQKFSNEIFAIEELRKLALELTVTETYFFRAREQIRAFVEVALPQQLARSVNGRVRILSAPCASGEEPYSLAMAIRETAPWAMGRVDIFAVDVNTAVLKKAEIAQYSHWALRELSAEQRMRWFNGESGTSQLNDEVRRSVTFEERNLAQDNADLWQARSWDVIFCRNMLMYFDPSVARKLVAKMAGSLAPNGYLFLGHAENLRGLSEDFALCHTHETFYYQLKGRSGDCDSLAKENESSASWRSAQAPAHVPLPAPPTLVVPESANHWVDAIGQASERIDNLARASLLLSTPAPEVRAHPDVASVMDLFRQERYTQALAQVDGMSAAASSHPEVLLLRAVSAVQGGELDEAERSSRKLLEHDAFNAGAHYILALCCEGRGDLAQAIEEDRTALYIDPGFAMARLHLGLIARRQRNHDLARTELLRALPALRGEDAARLLLFGGGFGREALIGLCEAELKKSGGV